MGILDSEEGNSGRCKAQSLHQEEVWTKDPTKTPPKLTSWRSTFPISVFYFAKGLLSQQQKEKANLCIQQPFYLSYFHLCCCIRPTQPTVPWAASENALLRTSPRAPRRFHTHGLCPLSLSPRIARCLAARTPRRRRHAALAPTASSGERGHSAALPCPASRPPEQGLSAHVAAPTLAGAAPGSEGADIPALPVKSAFQRLCLGVGKNKEGLSVHRQNPTLLGPAARLSPRTRVHVPTCRFPLLVAVALSNTSPVSIPPYLSDYTPFFLNF